MVATDTKGRIMNIRLCCSLLILLVLSACVANPAEYNAIANNYYEENRFDEALKVYQMAQVTAPDAPQPYFNAASAFAQLGDLEQSLAALNQTLKTADSELRAKAYYNSGNVYFQMSLYDQAVQSYQQTLLYNPGDNDARYNLELALNKLIPPSATPLPQPQKPDSQATPTSNLGEENLKTPTPASQDSSLLASTEVSAESESANLESTMSLEEASRLLDSIQQDQGTLRDEAQTEMNDQPRPEKDW
jgi:Ca-activated chloride channel homolog